MTRKDRAVIVAVNSKGEVSAVFVHDDDVALNTVNYRSHLAQASHVRRLKASAVPDACGENIHHAPARGRLMQRPLRKAHMTPEGRPVLRPDSEIGRDGKRVMGARVSDIWDTIEHQARAAHRKNSAMTEAAGMAAQLYQSPYTHGQVSAARDYAALVERLHGSGMKCSALEAQSGGSSGNSGREEAIMRDIDRLRFIRGLIGDGYAKEAKEDDSRRSITVRRLVDQVALSGWSITRILEVDGWPSNGRTRKELADALRSALDRMQGYKSPAPQ